LTGRSREAVCDAEARAAAGGLREARDLAMLELFYSNRDAALRARGLNDPDVDLVSDQVKLRGKGKKERIVPVGSHATAALRNTCSNGTGSWPRRYEQDRVPCS